MKEFFLISVSRYAGGKSEEFMSEIDSLRDPKVQKTQPNNFNIHTCEISTIVSVSISIRMFA